MGRGLSELQTSILKMAYQHRTHSDADEVAFRARFSGRQDQAPDDLHTWEAMIALYDCVEKPRYPRDRGPSGRLLDRFGGQRISIERTGGAKYRAAAAAINRAFTRLEARGLVERHWYGVISLTDRGIEEASRVTVTSEVNCPHW